MWFLWSIRGLNLKVLYLDFLLCLTFLRMTHWWRLEMFCPDFDTWVMWIWCPGERGVSSRSEWRTRGWFVLRDVWKSQPTLPTIPPNWPDCVRVVLVIRFFTRRRADCNWSDDNTVVFCFVLFFIYEVHCTWSVIGVMVIQFFARLIVLAVLVTQFFSLQGWLSVQWWWHSSLQGWLS